MGFSGLNVYLKGNDPIQRDYLGGSATSQIPLQGPPRLGPGSG